MTPTPEQLAKLPKWAQEHIEIIERERFVAVRALNEFSDTQTQSPFYHEKFTCPGEENGPSNKRVYIDAHTIVAEYHGIHLEIQCATFSEEKKGIQIQWSSTKRGTGNIALVPESYQSARLLTKEDMR